MNIKWILFMVIFAVLFFSLIKKKSLKKFDVDGISRIDAKKYKFGGDERSRNNMKKYK